MTKVMPASVGVVASGVVLVVLLASCSSGASSPSASPNATSTSPSSTSAVTPATPQAKGTTLHWRMDAVPSVPEQHCGSPQLCVALGTESGTLDGDLRGTSFVGNSAVFAKSGKFVVARTDVFRGTVKGCGSGTLVMVGTERADVHSGSGEWRIAAGFGTGDLARVTGHGTGRGTVDATGFHSQWQGVIDCK